MNEIKMPYYKWLILLGHTSDDQFELYFNWLGINPLYSNYI
jgi:hypothetical protein